jgi:hypothetical protein
MQAEEARHQQRHEENAHATSNLLAPPITCLRLDWCLAYSHASALDKRDRAFIVIVP